MFPVFDSPVAVQSHLESSLSTVSNETAAVQIVKRTKTNNRIEQKQGKRIFFIQLSKVSHPTRFKFYPSTPSSNKTTSSNETKKNYFFKNNHFYFCNTFLWMVGKQK